MLKQLNQDIISAIKLNNPIKRDILRIIVGEIQNIQATSKKMTDEQIQSLIRKQIKANNEMIEYGAEPERLEKENAILEGYLPKVLSQNEIKLILLANQELSDDIREAGSGKGMGLAMKYLKSDGYSVLGQDVKFIVEDICK